MDAGLATRAAGAATAAAAFLVASLAAISEIAAEPTSEAGVLSSTWTPLRGIGALVGGSSWFGGDWAFRPIAVGLVLAMVAAVGLGLAGIAVISFLLGPAPGVVAAMAVGAAWGLVMQIAVVGLLIGGLLGDLPAYEALPRWGWWLSTGTWGIALGLLCAVPVHVGRGSGVEA